MAYLLVPIPLTPQRSGVAHFWVSLFGYLPAFMEGSLQNILGCLSFLILEKHNNPGKGTVQLPTWQQGPWRPLYYSQETGRAGINLDKSFCQVGPAPMDAAEPWLETRSDLLQHHPSREPS